MHFHKKTIDKNKTINVHQAITRSALMVILLMGVLLLAACGESAEEKRRKAELATEIVELRKQIDSTRTKIEEVKLRKDSLRALTDTTTGAPAETEDASGAEK